MKIIYCYLKYLQLGNRHNFVEVLHWFNQGEYKDWVYKCRRCGELLKDYQHLTNKYDCSFED